MSSIFDKKDFSKIKNFKIDDLKNSLIKNFWGKNFLEGYMKPTIKWNDLASEYSVQILEDFNTQSVLNDIGEEDLDYLEFVYNIILYGIFKYKEEYKDYYEVIDINLIQGWINIILKIFDSEGFEFKKIEKNKHKLVSKDITQLINQIEKKEWRSEIDLFFTLSNNKWTEKEKILSWLAEHLTGEIRDKIETGMFFFNKSEIKNLFKDLNNIYKHFNNDKKGPLLDDFNNFQKLSLSEKNKKANKDMWFITYLLVEYTKINSDIKKKK